METNLDPCFVPLTSFLGEEKTIRFAMSRPNGTCSHFKLGLKRSLTPTQEEQAVERTLKSLLWAQGASEVHISGADEFVPVLRQLYSREGGRAFDVNIFHRIYGHDIQITACKEGDLPDEQQEAEPLGRHLEGCRIGFDLGGSDRKCAAVVDGKVVFSKEIPWDPYFQTDSEYHRSGIADSIRLAAEAMPRVDAIGGSSAGVFVDSEPRIVSLFRGIPDDELSALRSIFHDIGNDYGVPIRVINDGDVTALAGSMHLQANGVLGIAMGTSEAVGYVSPTGHITGWLNELAFVPIDLNPEAPCDEWSGDRGCGVNYLSQQAVARLIDPAGLRDEISAELPFPEQLLAVQDRMKTGDERAASIYETIGVYLSHACDWYARLYEVHHVLLLGRVMSGDGGDLILREAAKNLEGLGHSFELHTPDETFKRHGQAIAAASLPAIH